MKTIILTLLLTLLPACGAMNWQCEVVMTPDGAIGMQVCVKQAH